MRRGEVPLGQEGSEGRIAVLGIRYGVDNGAKVVNLSYGGWYGSQIRDACRYAWDRFATVCVAAAL